MGIIEAQDLAFDYLKLDENGEVESKLRAIDGVDLDIQTGDFIAILGHNGSGKSTLAKQIDALLLPTEGTLYVNGMDTMDESKLWDIRQSAGIVFQNPDNQIIGSVVEEDVGFGPENMGVPEEKIWERWRKASARSACGNTVQVLRTNSPGGRSSVSRLQGSWQCVPSVLCWMSRPQCSIRMVEKK